MPFRQTPNTLQANPESDSKAPDGKDQNTSKKLKGCSGGKAGESGKAASGSGNDGGATRRYFDVDLVFKFVSRLLF